MPVDSMGSLVGAIFLVVGVGTFFWHRIAGWVVHSVDALRGLGD